MLAAMMVAVGANAQETEPVHSQAIVSEIPAGNAWLLTGAARAKMMRPRPFSRQMP